jgi:prepilin-type N-terminal cleavage/methylation domain-containing protein
MPKRQHQDQISGPSGFTLLEVMVSTGLAGIVMVVIMFLLFQSGKFSATMNGNFETIEGVADTVSIFTNVLGQATRIQTCRCRANSNTRANCIWDQANEWYDPIRTGGAASGVVLLSGEYEAYNGATSLTSLDNIATSSINIGQTCLTQSSDMASQYLRGCKLPFSLRYYGPVDSSGATPSTAGKLVLTLGTGKSIQIGNNTKTGANGLGVTEVSCGFDSSTGGVGGSDFVLNIRLKVRSTTSQNPNSTIYETWYPAGCGNYKNYCKGMFRDVQLKFAMRNLLSRGVYYWRTEGIKNCKTTAAAGSAAERCSGAWNGASCLARCIASGSASGNAAGCCSGQLSGGNCL